MAKKLYTEDHINKITHAVDLSSALDGVFFIIMDLMDRFRVQDPQELKLLHQATSLLSQVAGMTNKQLPLSTLLEDQLRLMNDNEVEDV